MRVAIIGGTGHIGSYLTPRLFEAGHTVLSISRGQQKPYRPDAAWSQVQYIHLDRKAEEEAGNFGERIAALDPEAVIDLACYTPESAQQLVRSLTGVRALEHRQAASGESFHVVSPQALTLRGYAERVAAWFGKLADLAFLTFDEWKSTVSERDARVTLDHIAHAPNCSIEKARKLLNYAPRYTSLEAVREAVTAMNL